MTKFRFLPSLIPSSMLRASLLAVLLVACAPAASTQSVGVSPASRLPIPTATAEIALQPTASPEGTLAPTPLPVVTSRGPHLEATDPKTVSMASGGLQLVEFFEFW